MWPFVAATLAFWLAVAFIHFGASVADVEAVWLTLSAPTGVVGPKYLCFTCARGRAICQDQALYVIVL